MAGGSARDIKNRISATKKTSQITKAMNMVSAAKLRRAEKTIRDYRPFMKNVKDTIAHILNSNLDVTHKMLEKREVKKTGYLIISSDRGLAGGYNNNIFRQFITDVEERHSGSNGFMVGIIGNKGFNFFKTKDMHLVNKQSVIIRDDVQFIDIVALIQQMIDLFIVGEIDEIVVYYNKYINTMNQKVTREKILPIDKVEGETRNILYELEPTPQAVLDTLMPIYIENIIYGFILNAKASEHASRMTAMKSATDNALEIVDKLTLHYNRARQASITREISEIVGGAAALKQD